MIGLVTLVCDVTERKELERSVPEVSEREQRRIGGDLHDGRDRELPGVSRLLKRFETALGRDSPQHINYLRQTEQVVQTEISSTRSFAHCLAPVDHERAGLPPALAALLERIQETVNSVCHFDCTGDLGYPLGRWSGLPDEEWQKISGHSARVGATQDLLALNIDLASVMQTGRWKDTRMPMRYREKVLARRGGMARAAKEQGRV